MELNNFRWDHLPPNVQQHFVRIACQQLGQQYQYGILPLIDHFFNETASATYDTITISPKTPDAAKSFTEWLQKHGRSLTNLSVEGCYDLHGLPLNSLIKAIASSARKLQSLNLTHLAWPNTKPLQKLTSLTSLGIHGTHKISVNIFKLTNLRSLSITGDRDCYCNGLHIRPLVEKLVHLEDLTLDMYRGMQIDESYTSLQKLRQLKSIKILNYTPAEALQHLVGLPFTDITIQLDTRDANDDVTGDVCSWLQQRSAATLQDLVISVEGFDYRSKAKGWVGVRPERALQLCASVGCVKGLRSLDLAGLTLGEGCLNELSGLQQLIRLGLHRWLPVGEAGAEAGVETAVVAAAAACGGGEVDIPATAAAAAAAAAGSTSSAPGAASGGCSDLATAAAGGLYAAAAGGGSSGIGDSGTSASAAAVRESSAAAVGCQQLGLLSSLQKLQQLDLSHSPLSDAGALSQQLALLQGVTSLHMKLPGELKLVRAGDVIAPTTITTSSSSMGSGEGGSKADAAAVEEAVHYIMERVPQLQEIELETRQHVVDGRREGAGGLVKVTCGLTYWYR